MKLRFWAVALVTLVAVAVVAGPLLFGATIMVKVPPTPTTTTTQPVEPKSTPAPVQPTTRVVSSNLPGAPSEVMTLAGSTPYSSTPGGPEVGTVPAATYGVATALPVLAVQGSESQVQLPGPPNGLTGWVATNSGATVPDPWSVVVSLPARTITIYSSGRVVATAPAAVGAPSTPTPAGWTFVDGDIQTVGVDSAEAPVLRTLALHQVGRAAAIDQAEISATQIAIHGWDSGTVTGPRANPVLWSPDGHGHAISHGCIRVPVGAGVLGLIAKIPNGTRVDITT